MEAYYRDKRSGVICKFCELRPSGYILVDFPVAGAHEYYQENEFFQWFEGLMGIEAQAAEFMDQKWTYELTGNLEDGWFIRVVELPGCMTQGADFGEAMRMIADAMFGWIVVELEDGQEIPKPQGGKNG